MLIRVSHVGVSPQDLQLFGGATFSAGNGETRFPLVPGSEFSGRIAAIGSNVTAVAEGDPVVIDPIRGCGACANCLRGLPLGCTENDPTAWKSRGGCARYTVTSSRSVHRLADDLSLEAAVLAYPLALAVSGVRRLDRVIGRIAPHTPCAVIGTGVVGRLAVALLELRAYAVTKFSAEPPASPDGPSAVSEVIRDMRVLDRFGIVVETSGTKGLEAALRHSAAGATILSLDYDRFAEEIPVALPGRLDRTVVGVTSAERLDLAEALRLLPALYPNSFVTTRWPLERFSEAWTVAGQDRSLKVILDVG